MMNNRGIIIYFHLLYKESFISALQRKTDTPEPEPAAAA